MSCSVGRELRVEAPEEVDDLDDGELRVHRRRLEADPDPLLELRRRRDVDAEDDRPAAVGRAQPFEHLDRRRLARAIRAEQAEDLARGSTSKSMPSTARRRRTFDEAADADDRISRDVGG